MFVRMTRVEGAPDRFEQAIANYEQQIAPLRQIAGFAGAALLADRATNAGISVTYWETKEALDASEQQGEKARRQVAQETGSRIVDVDRFELVIAERTAPPRANTFIRVNDISGATDKIDAGIRFVREQLPVLKQQTGFRALLMSVNRQSGRSAISSVWETAADREASEAAMSGRRGQLAEIMGAPQVKVEMFESVFADVKATAPISG